MILKLWQHTPVLLHDIFRQGLADLHYENIRAMLRKHQDVGMDKLSRGSPLRTEGSKRGDHKEYRINIPGDGKQHGQGP